MRNDPMIRRCLAAALSLLLVLACAAASAGPIARTIANSTANTLDNLPEAARERTDSVIFGVAGLTGETNPFWACTDGDEYLVSLLYDELLFMNAAGEMGDGAASLAAEADGRTYTFTLHKGLAYADGTAVTADDFINAFYLVLNPAYDGVYDLSRAGISGVGAYLSGESDTVSGITRVDSDRFSVTFDRAGGMGLEFIALPALRVSLFGDMRRPGTLTDPEAFGGFYEDGIRRVRSVSAEDMAYGQYLLSELYVDDRAELRRNEAYWRGKPNIAEVGILVIPAGEELDAILSGRVDIISMLGSVEAVDRACGEEAGFINLYTWMGDVIGYLSMDLSSPLFGDLGVRRALACGFDRETARMDSVERYGQVPGMLLFDSFSTQADLLGEQYPYDPDRAAELLAQAGWAPGDDGVLQKDGVRFSFTLLCNTPNPILDRILGSMQRNYAALGIEMTVEAVPFGTLVDRLAAGDYQMAFQARRLDASAAVSADLFVGDSRLNTSGYTSETAQRLLQWLAQEEDPERQGVLLEGIYQQIYLDLPFIPLYRRNELLLMSARILNAQVTTAHEITSDVYHFILTDSLKTSW